MQTRIPTPGEVASDPILYANTMLKILDKRKRLVPLRYNAIQRQWLRERTSHDLVLKARQMGFSTVIQAELFRKVTTEPSATGTLAHDDKATQRLRRMADRFYEHLPLVAKKPKRKYSNASVTTYPKLMSEAEIATAGSHGAGRSASYTHLHGSEVAFWPDAKAIMTGMMQAGDPVIVLESTANGAQGWFYERCMEALNGFGKYKLHFFPWWLEPGYAIPLEEGEILDYSTDEANLIERHGLTPQQIKWRRDKKQELKEAFDQEYPEDPITCFLVSGTGYFNISPTTWMAPIGATPQEGHLYYGGIDWGQKQDFTVVSIIDETTGCQVELARKNGLRMKELRHWAIRVLRPWNPRLTLVELNSMGQQQFEEMEEETDLNLAGFTMSPTNKGPVVRAHRISLEDQGLKLLPIDYQQHEYRSFQASQTTHGHWKYGAASGAHDDTVIATALADHARKIAPPMGAWGSA